MNVSHDASSSTTQPVRIGWGHADITPDRPVSLCGQFHMRVSEGVLDPVTATALALSSGAGDRATTAIMVSCDLVHIPDSLRDAVRERVAETDPDIPPETIVLNATHTHDAPHVFLAEDYEKKGSGIGSEGMDLDFGIMSAEEYSAFAAGRIADAVRAAWSTRAPGATAFGLGHAVVGRNRRSVYENGESRMYGDTTTPDFSHMEGCENHDVDIMATWNAGGDLTGVVVNVACPSQVSESLFEISADFWHETRIELRKRFGDDVFLLPQCSAAGDQSPRPPYAKAAEERMLALSGRTQRQEIAARIADAVETVLPCIEGERDGAPVLAHHVETVELTRGRISEDDVREATEEADTLRAEYERLRAELDADPSVREQPRWYVPVTRAYRRMTWCEGVGRRLEKEKTQPRLPVEAHVVRVGKMVFATNPFEYYLDFGVRIKARSAATQTFVVQLAGPAGYVPTERAVAGRSYGATPASAPVGPEGGRELVEWTVAAVASIFDDE